MWSFLKRFSSFFAIVKEEKLSKEEEDEIISNAFSKESLDLVSVDDGKTFQRLNGTITFTNYTTSVIDGKYYFHLKDSISPNLFVGDYVEFVFNETESKVMNVRKISNVDADPKAITMDHLKIKGENNEYFSVNGVIKNRIGRIVVVINEENPLEEIDFNLDCVCSEFIPSQGDFITLEGQIIDNQLSVNKIRPTITTIKSGIVTKWDVARGIISDFAWFTLESCEPGYIPIEGDKVLASLIRIDDPKGYMWRAIQVVNVFQNIGSFSQNDGEPRPDLICNHYGIFIPVLPKFTMQINKVMEFTVDVENNNSYNVELLLIFCNAGFEAQQISLISPIGKCSVIPSHRKLTCTFKIEAKYIGHSTIEYTWDFGEFELTRMFSLEVTSAELEELEFSLSKNQMPNPQFKITGLEILKQTYGDKMPGQKKYFRSSIYPVQLGQYPLPDQILLAALPQHKMNPDDLLIQIEKIIPSLREELSPKTYLPFLSGLLFLEEVELLRQSPSDEVCVKKSKSYTKVNWNRQGSGYGKNCSIENSIDVDIGPKRISEITWFNKELNNEQKEAITNILKGEARPLPYIIFGPPGTGKSVTFVETILQLHNLFPSCRILVATPSNSAADLLAERILEHGNVQQNKMLRLVGLSAFEQGKIAASLLPYTAMIDVKNDDDERYGVQVITREALKQFNIVIGTIGCVNVLFNLGFPRGFFTHIFVDEAGQATEPEILTVLVLLNTLNGQVILAGDPLQLGPVAYSKLAIKYGFQESLLSRLLDRFPYKRDVVGFPKSYGYDPRLVTKLVNNYRSLPPILQLPNMLFYNGDLIPKVLEKSSEESNLLSRLKLPLIFGKPEGNTPPLVFHGVQGMNHQENCSHSWYNPQEAYQVFAYLNMLYEAGVSPDHIGIITPYQLQVIKIRQMLEKVNMESPKIGSVEEFQGQEKMIIILSVVRSNLEFISYDTQRALGFVRNPRRLNVAISRARAMLIIIGNPHLLCLDQHWKKIIQFCISNKYYTGCDLPSGLT
ncbi:probable RNA helicase armi isoform X2 [Halyomorpha halys]|uniref:probable RNA helicase armi isoform X2 n=1 Tax=Halyomorpha halys TaxID=286706 RepID=UPI0034D212F1